ncbi:hypothetical protein WDV13_09530 [Weissella cibaria]|jgi:hypothetical protein|uniref:hypothetical protein n=1 Tax=Weissella cibaria TaxID=137591 RepID=UPI000E48A436|nr:hypothetical protein [Weissella cibaria]MCQ9620645.1 hypothetical protein [Weissella cibaria]RHE69803.1 hypothetical protein DW718_10960 [Weissella cibaria]RHE75912.1 hypothetical protein DW717_11025 [Weissella cibaria]
MNPFVNRTQADEYNESIQRVPERKPGVFVEERPIVGDVIALYWLDGKSEDKDLAWPPKWFNKAYRVDIKKEVSAFLKTGHIAELKGHEKLSFLKNDTLKEGLELLDISSRGNKADLVQQYAEFDDDVIESVVKYKAYKITDKGQKFLQQYQNIIAEHMALKNADPFNSEKKKLSRLELF